MIAAPSQEPDSGWFLTFFEKLHYQDLDRRAVIFTFSQETAAAVSIIMERAKSWSQNAHLGRF